MPPFELSKENVHFWLRKVFLYVWLVEPKENPIIIEARIDDLEKLLPQAEKDRWNKRPPDGLPDYEEEVKLREGLKRFLGNWPYDQISHEEAMEACREAYKMLREPFETGLQKIKSDPYCEGANPRRIS